MRELESPYITLVHREGITSVCISLQRGSGRQTRRWLWKWIYVPLPLNAESLPAVLRAVAHELEVSPSSRYRPPSGGLGSPSGAVGGETTS
jgi:hypothetical protein